MLVSEYRIVTNGYKYAVQRRRQFFGFTWWSFVKDASDYPETLYFTSKGQAAGEIAILLELEEEGRATFWTEVQ
jgi:hypothetical protein